MKEYNELTTEEQDLIDTLQYYQLKGYTEDYSKLLKEIEETNKELFKWIRYGNK